MFKSASTKGKTKVLKNRRSSNAYFFLKRLIDFAVSLFGIILLLLLFPFVAVLIKLDSKGPVFFTQERVGKDGVPFKIVKFRTMVEHDQIEKEELDFAINEQRITRVGKILRRTKIDEIPQLINVLKGEMSLVGPRPTIGAQVDNYTDYEKLRLKAVPGLTGLAQVNGNTALPWEDRIRYDITYIEQCTVALDLKILLKTIAIIIFGEEKFKEDP